MFNPETGNFCVTLPMTSVEMPLHNEESVGLWIHNPAPNWTQLKNKFSLVRANSQGVVYLFYEEGIFLLFLMD